MFADRPCRLVAREKSNQNKEIHPYSNSDSIQTYEPGWFEWVFRRRGCARANRQWISWDNVGGRWMGWDETKYYMEPSSFSKGWVVHGECPSQPRWGVRSHWRHEIPSHAPMFVLGSNKHSAIPGGRSKWAPCISDIFYEWTNVSNDPPAEITKGLWMWMPRREARLDPDPLARVDAVITGDLMWFVSPRYSFERYSL